MNSLNDLIITANKTGGIYGSKFPTKLKYSNEQSMWGSLMQMENEFGTVVQENFTIVTLNDIKNLFSRLKSKLIEKDMDKYKEQILRESAKRMIYG